MITSDWIASGAILISLGSLYVARKSSLNDDSYNSRLLHLEEQRFAKEKSSKTDEFIEGHDLERTYRVKSKEGVSIIIGYDGTPETGIVGRLSGAKTHILEPYYPLVSNSFKTRRELNENLLKAGFTLE